MEGLYATVRKEKYRTETVYRIYLILDEGKLMIIRAEGSLYGISYESSLLLTDRYRQFATFAPPWASRSRGVSSPVSLFHTFVLHRWDFVDEKLFPLSHRRLD